MNFIFTFILFLFHFDGKSLAAEITLVDRNAAESSVQSDNGNDNQNGSLNEDDEKVEDYQELDDFINDENERMKEIKLLNLDLEKANLHLKMKEIELKMSNLARVDGRVLTHNEDIKNDILIEILGIFESDNRKESILNINGIHSNVEEGQEINGLLVKAITKNSVVIQFNDGTSKELHLL